MKDKLPYNVMRHRSWDVAPRDPVTIGTSIATALGVTSTVGTYAIIAATYVATTAITSYALRALAPDVPSSAEANKTSFVNIREPAAEQEYVYGRIRKGGNIVYINSTAPYLHMVIALAGHEVESIEGVYINDELVTIDENGFVTNITWCRYQNDGGEPLDGDGARQLWPAIRIVKYTGSQTSVDPLLEELGVGSNFIGRGIPYLYVRMHYDPQTFASGVPSISALIRGKQVQDTNGVPQTWPASANAALVIRDYIKSEYGLDDDNVDDTYFASAANDCLDAIPLATGGFEARYLINGVVKSSTPIGQTLQDMVRACNGTLYLSGGKWRLKVGVYDGSVKSFTLDDLRSGIEVKTRHSRRDNFNKIVGKFTNQNTRWIESDYPSITSAAFLAEDDFIENQIDIPLYMVTSPSQAQRVAKQILFRSREQLTVVADFGLRALDVEVGDIIDLTIDNYGWSSKEFEVVTWKMFIGDTGAIRVNMTLRETSAAAFAWDAEESEIISNNSELPDTTYVPPLGISIGGGELRLVNQQVVGAIIVDVTVDPIFASSIEVQYRQTGSSTWLPVGSSFSVTSSNRFEVVGVQDGNFDFRARVENGIGIKSPWVEYDSIYVSLFEQPPQNVTNFAANVVGNTVHLTWTPTTDLDLSHYKIRFSNKTSGASYEDAIDLVQKVSRPANSITVPAQSGTYFIKAVDKLGNISPAPASIVVTTNIADIEALNVVETLPQHPDFAGSKTDVVVLSDDAGNYISLDTTTLFDSVDGDFDDQEGLFDGGGGGLIAKIGYYEFDDYVDLGQKYVSRVSTSLDIRYLEYANTFDAASGLFDSRAGDFDGDPSQFDNTTARTQVSYTDDDPSGSPTWSDWSDFIVGDISARAMRFRTILETSSDSAAPAVYSLTAIVDMPDRMESNVDISYTGTKVVTFPSAFKAAPAIGIAASLADGDRYVISGKSRTGFTITTYTGGTVSSNPTTFDYVAKGYGKELA